MREIPCEVYSRVSGYFRPLAAWNKGKQQEFSERKYLNIGEINGRYKSSNSDDKS